MKFLIIYLLASFVALLFIIAINYKDKKND